MKPIIGSNYWPNPTLRQMPRYWHLSDVSTERRCHWYRRVENWALIGVTLALLLACAQTVGALI